VTIRVEPSQQGGRDEYVRLAGMATMGEVLAELTATVRHYAKVRNQHHRATAWLSYGKGGEGHDPGLAQRRRSRQRLW